MDALSSMQSFLRSRPNKFHSLEFAIEWSMRSGQVRNADSARVSMPGQLKVCREMYILVCNFYIYHDSVHYFALCVVLRRHYWTLVHVFLASVSVNTKMLLVSFKSLKNGLCSTHDVGSDQCLQNDVDLSVVTARPATTDTIAEEAEDESDDAAENFKTPRQVPPVQKHPGYTWRIDLASTEVRARRSSNVIRISILLESYRVACPLYFFQLI